MQSSGTLFESDKNILYGFLYHNYTIIYNIKSDPINTVIISQLTSQVLVEVIYRDRSDLELPFEMSLLM